MSAGPSNLHARGLRLVGADDRPIPAPDTRESRREVARENRSAALAADDIRMVFATQAAQALEGGRAAILRPHRRRDLLAAASRMGLRPFDANLIIAVVQEQARRGEDSATNSPATLGLFSADPEDDPGRAWLWIVSILGGLVAFGVLCAWVAGG